MELDALTSTTNAQTSLIAAHLCGLDTLCFATQARLDRNCDGIFSAVDLLLATQFRAPSQSPAVTTPTPFARAGGRLLIDLPEGKFPAEWISVVESASMWSRTHLELAGTSLEIPLPEAPAERRAPFPALAWIRTGDSLPARVPFTMCPGPLITAAERDGDEALILRVEGLPKSGDGIRVRHMGREVEFTRTEPNALRVALPCKDGGGPFFVEVDETVSNPASAPRARKHSRRKGRGK